MSVVFDNTGNQNSLSLPLFLANLAFFSFFSFLFLDRKITEKSLASGFGRSPGVRLGREG